MLDNDNISSYCDLKFDTMFFEFITTKNISFNKFLENSMLDLYKVIKPVYKKYGLPTIDTLFYNNFNKTQTINYKGYNDIYLNWKTFKIVAFHKNIPAIQYCLYNDDLMRPNYGWHKSFFVTFDDNNKNKIQKNIPFDLLIRLITFFPLWSIPNWLKDHFLSNGIEDFILKEILKNKKRLQSKNVPRYKQKILFKNEVLFLFLKVIKSPASKLWQRDNSFVPLTTYFNNFKEFPLKGVYILRNNYDTLKYYVGQSKNIYRRMTQHFDFKTYEPKENVFYKDYYSLQKENRNKLFSIKIISCDTKAELDSIEMDNIYNYGSEYFGYNKTKGNW